MSEALPLHEQVAKLNLKASTCEQGEEREAKENTQQTPQRGGGTKNNATQSRKSREFSPQKEENEEGKWLLNHPWQDTRPDHGLQMNDTIEVSEKYSLPKQWLDEKTAVNLRRIYTYLPEFLSQMRGKSEREMLKEYMKAETKKDKKSKMTAHMKEITDKIEGKKPEDKAFYGNETYTAYSLNETDRENQQAKNVLHLDCEYMLKMYLPEGRKTWFKLENTPSGLIRAINGYKKDKRWIFTPSFRRAETALLDWPKDEIVTEESTIRILVVRPCEFGEYVERCGHTFPIISLPNDEIGAGYARFWIQNIALRLTLDFIWMIEDSVKCFYEYDPDKSPTSYTNQRRRQFGLVFERIEGFFKPPGKIAAMSPSNPLEGEANSPFTCKPPQAAVYLNIKAIKEKEVFYRPELKVFGEMMFGYECYMNGLDVFRDNRVRLQDHSWKDTGAISPPVRPSQEPE